MQRKLEIRNVKEPLTSNFKLNRKTKIKGQFKHRTLKETRTLDFKGKPTVQSIKPLWNELHRKSDLPNLKTDLQNHKLN